jgi:polar amino acid transport system substrate-binding protein
MYRYSLIIGLVLLPLLLCQPALAAAHPITLENPLVRSRIIVGVTDFPPFFIKKANGHWTGLSIDVWRRVAAEAAIPFDLREYGTIREMTAAIESGELDLIPALAVTEKYEIGMDLSHAYYHSGFGIAVETAPDDAPLGPYLLGLLSPRIIRLIMMLSLIAVIAGLSIWLFERRANPSMFGGNAIKGLGQGLWWALVTMTTVGYGDKAPRTIGGRITAVVWMFFSIILITSYTAVITTNLTVEELSGRVRNQRDLPDVRVGALAASERMEYLTDEGLAVVPFKSIQSGLQALADDRIDAFVDDETQLRHIIRTDFPGQLHVLADTFAHYGVGMAIASESPLRETLNRALVKLMEQPDWEDIQEKYVGLDQN